MGICPSWLRSGLLFGALLVVFLCATGSAQTPQAFEAADVHASAPNATESGGLLPNGRFELQGLSMLSLIQTAYAVAPAKIMGGPPWIDTTHFDIVAKMPAGLKESDSPELIKALLVDRFKLVVHNEDRPLPVYAIVLARKGPQLKESSGDAAGQCQRSNANGVISLVCTHTTMAQLAERLPGAAPSYFNNPVLDRTGLTGSYDFTLKWAARAQLGPGGASDSGAISLFDVLDKELGLKVESQTQVSSVLVVDRVNETPTPNAPSVAELIPPAPTEFEVASVRPSDPSLTQQSARLNGGQIEIHGLTLKTLIVVAYNFDDDARVVGGEKWLDSDRFEIIAKAAPTTPIDTLRIMLRALLEERFGLKTHSEDRPVTVYALTAPKSGPKLKTSDGSARSQCVRSASDGAIHYACSNTTMAQFAERLPDFASGYLDHPMVDLTGLAGAYDFTLSWVPANRTSAGRGGDSAQQSASPAGASTPSGGLTVFEAVDRQLGLKLAQQKHPVRVLVIDKVNRTPTDN